MHDGCCCGHCQTTAMVHMQGSYKGKSPIIGFFWAAAADCDFVMVTRAGLEIYTLTGDRQASTNLDLHVRWAANPLTSEQRVSEHGHV